MTYHDFRKTIQRVLRLHPEGLTWRELRAQAGIDSDRACPTWTRRLEAEIGLVRREKKGRQLIWQLSVSSERK